MLQTPRTQHPPLRAALRVGWSSAGHQRRAGLLDSFARRPVEQFLRQVRVRAHLFIVTAGNPGNSFT